MSAAHRDKVDGLVQRAIADGALVHSASKSVASETFFYPPTVVVDASRTSEISTQEVFGPVLVDHRYTDDDIAALANDSGFGLAAGIFGRDLG
ncbi:aldehyde dehydrogenase family protein [Rhodococcoides kyotonense]|uniref:aldehyde dehydrogenase family protein n=1 Tax=Rhodococcoides kyotonense TaxID=398843 RepID=UPI001FE38570|nr:aldehyde dehydrogenase family protein [Rhodococcus kyotonensis]